MTKVPIMPLNVEQLLADPKVKRMGSGEVQAFWEWFLTKMWSNHGWLPAEDKLLARFLEIDVRRWRGFYRAKFEPLLLRDFSPILGDIYRQPHLTKVWDDVGERIDQNRKRTAPARAKRARKSAKASSVTEKKNGPVTQTVTASVTETVTTPNQDIRKNSALQAESSFSLSQTASAVARPALEGRSLPSSPVVDPEPIHPADAMSPEARQRIADGMAALSRDLGAKLSMSRAADFPAYQHKPWEIADEADPDTTAEPGRDRVGQGDVPDAEGAAPGDASPEDPAEGQGGGGGEEAPEQDPDESPLMRALNRRKPS